MPFIKRNWAPHETDSWTREDLIAIVLSPLSYILIAVGLPMSFFLLPTGFILLGIGVLITVIMFWVIDPKLDAQSAEYEKKQKEYLKELERQQRWEETS